MIWDGVHLHGFTLDGTMWGGWRQWNGRTVRGASGARIAIRAPRPF